MKESKESFISFDTKQMIIFTSAVKHLDSRFVLNLLQHDHVK